MKVEEKKVNWQGTSVPGNNMVVSSLGSLFASYIPDLKQKEPETQKCQRDQTKKKKASVKTCCLYPKDRKGTSYQERKILDNNHSTSTKHQRARTLPISQQQRGQLSP